MNTVSMDKRLKIKIESLIEWGNDVYSISFKDLNDTFWFNKKTDLQEFVKRQEVERFYDKQLRKGYFDYINENNELVRYDINCNRGNLTVVNEITM